MPKCDLCNEIRENTVKCHDVDICQNKYTNCLNYHLREPDFWTKHKVIRKGEKICT